MNFNLIKNEIKNVCLENIKSTKFLSIKDLKVELIDYNTNPYKVMCNMALCTWGLINNKWKNLSPETRFYVVKEILERKALPLALEVPFFSLSIENCSRAAFDQIARTRLGVVFASKGQKDNDLSHLNFIIPSKIKNTIFETKFKEYCLLSKSLYNKMQEHKIPNWSARCVFNIYAAHRFIMCINFKSLQQLCNNRMQTTEMEDTVAISWLFRERIKEQFPLLAEYLRPNCDFIKKDTTLSVNGFNNILGIPHISDGRWSNKEELEEQKKIAKFNEPCSDISLIELELGIKIKKNNEWTNYEWNTLKYNDKKLFEED